MVRSWFVVVVILGAVACGHSTPSPRESPEGSAELTPTGSASTPGSANATDSANGPSEGSETAAPGSPHDDEAHGDERHYQPLDLKVWDSHMERGKLIVIIALPREMSPDSVDYHWTGIFTSDGNAINGTNFAVAGVNGHAIRVEYSAATLPSRTVRLFHPRS